MKKPGLETAVQIATILAGFGAIANQDVRQFYSTTVAVPVWLMIVLLVGCWVLWSRYRSGAAKTHEVSAAETIRVDAGRLHSAVPLSSEPLKCSAGGYGVWLYLHQFGQGIRHVENNRYVFGHASEHGRSREVDGGHRYFNVFALSSSPTRGGLIWKVWVSNDKGESFTISAPDSEAYGEGWHHFVVRWDSHRPLLELLIDGTMAAVSHDSIFTKRWPNRIEDAILVGTWPNRAQVHFINTYVYRARGFTLWPADEVIQRELQVRPNKANSADTKSRAAD